MALRKRRYIPDCLGDGLTIDNSNKKLIGIKTTEKEILILNESGFVVGILDKGFFGLGEKKGFSKNSPEVEKVKKAVAKSHELARKKTAKTKPETKAEPKAKRTVKK